jgi:hypothetical protein
MNAYNPVRIRFFIVAFSPVSWFVGGVRTVTMERHAARKFYTASAAQAIADKFPGSEVIEDFV